MAKKPQTVELSAVESVIMFRARVHAKFAAEYAHKAASEANRDDSRYYAGIAGAERSIALALVDTLRAIRSPDTLWSPEHGQSAADTVDAMIAEAAQKVAA